MMCDTAKGEILPMYAIYKSTHLWDAWMKGGPPGCRYDTSDTGWFHTKTFANWF